MDNLHQVLFQLHDYQNNKVYHYLILKFLCIYKVIYVFFWWVTKMFKAY